MKAWKWLSVVALALAVLNPRGCCTPSSASCPACCRLKTISRSSSSTRYYARDVDSALWRDASWMYTDDGVWDLGGNQKFVGTAALKKFYVSTPPGMTRNGVRHFSTNLVLVPTAEGARGSAYHDGARAEEQRYADDDHDVGQVRGSARQDTQGMALQGADLPR